MNSEYEDSIPNQKLIVLSDGSEAEEKPRRGNGDEDGNRREVWLGSRHETTTTGSVRKVG